MCILNIYNFKFAKSIILAAIDVKNAKIRGIPKYYRSYPKYVLFRIKVKKNV